jgi:NAD(P)-dependent dehydrogenase (short-subunit alcohol dehydrogenase family)
MDALVLLHCTMRVLITGGAGFIGRHLTEYFQDRADVRIIDNLRSGLKSNLSGLKCELIVGSILDRDLLREAMRGVDFVFHLAAMVSVQESVHSDCFGRSGTGACEKADLQQLGRNLRRQSNNSKSRKYASGAEQSLRHSEG